MLRKAMGSDLIEAAEAAELLGVSHRSVHHFVRQGLLHPRYPRGRKLNAPALFHREEVAALAEVRERKLDFRQVAATALQAHVSARSLERRVEFLETLLGSKYATLSMEEEDVVAVYADARQASEAPPARVDEIMRWSSIFMGIGEEFLEALEAFTSDSEAWRVFLDLASATIRDAPLEDFAHDKELEMAYAYLKYARETMRRVVFFHVRNRYGERTANEFITTPEEDVHAGVLRLLGGVLGNH